MFRLRFVADPQHQLWHAGWKWVRIHEKRHAMNIGRFLIAILVAAAISATAARAADKNSYRVTILVSNEAGEAPVLDPKLVNAWGIAASCGQRHRLRDGLHGSRSEGDVGGGRSGCPNGHRLVQRQSVPARAWYAGTLHLRKRGWNDLWMERNVARSDARSGGLLGSRIGL